MSDSVRSKFYNESIKYHSAWTASSVKIETLKGRKSYMYECLPINDNSNNNGIAIFNFERDNQHSPAKKMVGFSSDLHIGKRIKALEVKISDYCNIPEDEALNQAKEIYYQYKDRF